MIWRRLAGHEALRRGDVFFHKTDLFFKDGDTVSSYSFGRLAEEWNDESWYPYRKAENDFPRRLIAGNPSKPLPLP